MQAFSSSGEPAGDEFNLGPSSKYVGAAAELAFAPGSSFDSNFVVTWPGLGPSGEQDTLAQGFKVSSRFPLPALSTTAETPVVIVSSNNTGNPRIAISETGDVTIASGGDVRRFVLSEPSIPIPGGSNLRLDPNPGEAVQTQRTVGEVLATPDGGFTLLSSNSIRLYSASGTPVSDWLQIFDASPNVYLYDRDAAVDMNGNITILALISSDKYAVSRGALDTPRRSHRLRLKINSPRRKFGSGTRCSKSLSPRQ